MGQAGFGESLICGAAAFTETSKLEAVVPGKAKDTAPEAAIAKLQFRCRKNNSKHWAGVKQGLEALA
jgi:hypothetical protein